ncbi:MAG: hypothetical protein RBS55_00310 [Bacteroidales bacterium]|jgi:REP element-mobilizing transposase RayT|nr:hypothetical protein [Bacteroidales bacterium]
MAELYRNRYRIKSARCPNWNYGSKGAYFITICTKGRNHYFGEIFNKTMILSKAGLIVENCWHELPSHFPNIQIDAFITMPNHVHGLIIIHQNLNKPGLAEDKTTACNKYDNGEVNQVIPEKDLHMSMISPKSGTVSTIIRSYKSACTNAINKSLPAMNFGWQPRYYDIIIRDYRLLYRIRRYIRLNPKYWKG